MIRNVFPNTKPDMNITSPTCSVWNAEYTHIMPVSNFDTQGYTNSCYNFESRELYFQYDDFEMSNFYTYSGLEDMYDFSREDYITHTNSKPHAAHFSGNFERYENDRTQIIRNGASVNATWDALLCPTTHNETFSEEICNYQYEEGDRFDANR